ncbi:glycoside hydrolase family 23 protein [Hygrophoropsis aurantiaca]|uniref:Glycoside hydrolase family 23 protein n=1 Tax=Hygrophoropsis aurantiaca TaxID=72124 RepID=A0ACB8AK91_9AGAM|nr:glycoside hydrolase family 23 protein [Hygrophoropsis aurantiaca]
MKISSSLIAILATVTVAVQAGHTGGIPNSHVSSAKHARLSRNDVRVDAPPVKLSRRKSCKPKVKTNAAGAPPPAQSSPTASHSKPPPAASSAPASKPPPSGDSSSSDTSSGGGLIEGLIKVASFGDCGSSGATKEITATSGPNGNIDFLNCGLTEGGWTPPFVKVSDIVSAELSQVAYNPKSAFTACKDFVWAFEKYGEQYGVPAILLASFAMQESSCNSSTIGGAGEQGLMQITQDKCGGAPNGNCRDIDFNIHAGAKFFSQTLNDNGGNLLLSIGQYNGWHNGLTYGEATAAAHKGNCHWQNNLDYLHQFLNGWVQDVNAYQHNPPLGKYFNLKSCGN